MQALCVGLQSFGCLQEDATLLCTSVAADTSPSPLIRFIVALQQRRHEGALPSCLANSVPSSGLWLFPGRG